MSLTAKQEAFAQAVAGGMTQADAYRSAYDAENMGANSIGVEASRLMDDPNVSLRVKGLKDAVAMAAIWSRLDSVQTLADIARDSEARANEKVSAIKELNAMHGFNEPLKMAINGSIVTRVELVALK